jgi:hypothetical protein
MQKWKINHSYISKAQGVSRYHHYLQHTGHSCLEETMRSMMYWKGMCTTIRRYVKTCQSYQINKRHSQKYGHPPPKLVITTPWKALCLGLIGPYTLKGKDGSSIDFMCLTMINPATSWFEIAELPTVAQETTVPPAGKGKKVTFDENTKIPFIADWQKIGEHRQRLRDLNNAHENKGRIDYDYKVGQKVLLRKEGILCKAESRWHKNPWLITSVHTNGTMMVQHRNKIERMNIWRVKPFEEDLDNK